ncbi:hypothetical protein [Solimonas marina]|uniref:Uncharacterized protein n=1 Tax=Solimonas marina TaxID=2714601 RepID=A0A970B7T1_9GAMM|nr:hypothetical protein [Solimonas marina]NKF21549.1 hypothetical protein [Solimonas marina]
METLFEIVVCGVGVFALNYGLAWIAERMMNHHLPDDGNDKQSHDL